MYYGVLRLSVICKGTYKKQKERSDNESVPISSLTELGCVVGSGKRLENKLSLVPETQGPHLPSGPWELFYLDRLYVDI